MNITSILVRVILGLVSIAALSGCVGVRRYETFTKTKAKEILAANQYVISDGLTIEASRIEIPDSIVKVEKVRSYFIPAIFFWQSKHELRCDISPELPISIFKNEFYSLAADYNIKGRLGDRSLEIDITEISKGFLYSHNETVVFLLLFYVLTGGETIYPLPNSGLSLKYRVILANEILQEGELSLPERQQPLYNVFKSTKKFTRAYLDEYQRSYQQMARQVFHELLERVD